MKELSLYIHLPFCVRKCLYCDFLSAPAGEETRSAYLQALIRQIRQIRQESPAYEEYTVKTVFFGGGTPTVLSAGQLNLLLQTLRAQFRFAAQPEISIECNPGTTAAQQLQALHEGGFNRLSIGLQSAQNAELARLGRIHTWEQFLETYRAARAAGFDNVNVDLMAALPGQTLQSYEDTLGQVLMLHPEHLSAYSLIIEPGTPFYEKYHHADEQREKTGEGSEGLPSEEQERQMYAATKRLLAEQGYQRYEISNYALPGKACLHNCVYWRRGNYLGLGIGAASLIGSHRWKTAPELDAYLQGKSVRVEEETLSRREEMEEFMFLGLRMTEGISTERFAMLFGQPFDEIYGKTVQKLAAEGLLCRQEDCVRLTDFGVDVSNYVFEACMLDDEGGSC